MLKKAFFILLMALVLVCVAGCGIRSGEVLSRQFVPAHTESGMRYNPLTEMLEVYTDHIPDRWFITIGQKGEDGRYRTNTICVSQATYERYNVGDWASFD